MGNIYGYARCSTDERRQDIDRQRQALIRAGVPGSENIYWEYESGTVKDRPELQKLLSSIKPGDTIIATEVSRLTRSTLQLCELIDLIKECHLRLIIGSVEIDCRAQEADAMTMGMIMMLGVFAEMERELISQRIKSGIATAKSKGKAVGRPRLDVSNLPAKFWKHYPAYQKGALTKTELATLCGVSRMSIYRYIRLIETDRRDADQ